jgi:hypothetical protein
MAVTANHAGVSDMGTNVPAFKWFNGLGCAIPSYPAVHFGRGRLQVDPERKIGCG